MIVRDYGSKLLLLLVFSMVGMVCCNAQSGKSLSVKKVMCTASPEGEAVPSLLDENGIEFQPLDVVNWKDYPYKPEVSFRIAHTGREILLHYKVKEASVRAVASGDNGRVWEDACVEFFVSPEGDDRYYNFVGARWPANLSRNVWASAAGNWPWLFPFPLSSSIPSVLWTEKQ